MAFRHAANTPRRDLEILADDLPLAETGNADLPLFLIFSMMV